MKKIRLSAFTLGLTSMIGQIIIIRELIVVFYGNELSLGVILAIWLFWTSVGSGLVGRIVDKISIRKTLLSATQIITSIALPLNIFLVRNIRHVLDIPTGKIIGFAPMFTACLVSLSAICVLLGFTFTLIARLSSENSAQPSKSIGNIYLLEGLGASVGGIVYSFFLVQEFSAFHIALMAGGCNILTSVFFNRNVFQLAYLAAILAAFVFDWPLHLDKFTRSMQFAPFKVVKSADSIYGNITITKTGKDYSFYENGFLMFTSNDELTSEESVHYAMLEHPAPKNILLIGNGQGGSLAQILKHNVDKIDYVELDPLIISLAEKFMPGVKSKKINTLNMDGRLFVKQYSSKLRGDKDLPPPYDVVIINLPDPYTAMLNRFYSLEFFREVKTILAKDGLFSFSMSSSENYINPENAAYLGCIYNTLKQVFGEIKTLPGDNVVFLASEKSGLLTYDTDILIKRLKERKIKSLFVREYYLPFKINPLRIKYIENTLREFGGKKINKDFRPIGYFYNMLLWMTLFSAGRGFLPYIGFLNIYSLSAVIFLIFILLFLAQKFFKPSFRAPVALSVATTGMSEISFQIIVILAFQSLYGYMYYRISLILTSFMIGLVAGSFLINRQLGHIKNERTLYLKTQGLICIYPLALPLIFMYLSRLESLKSAEIGFMLLPIIAGFIGGFQFPLANKICLNAPENAGKTTGFLYGIDLLGSSIGGLLIGLLLLPVLGIVWTCVLLSFINTMALILLFSNRRYHNQLC